MKNTVYKLKYHLNCKIVITNAKKKEDVPNIFSDSNKKNVLPNLPLSLMVAS